MHSRLSSTHARPLLVGIASLLIMWFSWGSIHPPAVVEDEVSYVLQSRIFASGHWTAPSPPLPEFFQQGQVLTVPAVASKYPPGHALLMSVGSLVGAPALMPLLLTALTGALLFLLVCRVTNPFVAALTCIIWLSDPIELEHRPGYFSEVTSSMMWMIALWALLEWRAHRRTRWLLVLAAAIGWGAITRPLTMLAFAVPVGIVVVRDVIRTHRWRDFALAIFVGCCFLGILPVWSARTTGNWRLTPQTLYTRDYLPYDKPGFGLDTTPPALPLLPVDRFTYVGFQNEHKRHTLTNLPAIAWERLKVIGHDEWSGPRLVLVPFAILGLFAMNASLWFAFACSTALFVGYLSYGHWAHWTIYYLEGIPTLSVVTALGVALALERIEKRFSDGPRSRIASAPAAAVAALLLLVGYESVRSHANHRRDAVWDVAFHELLDQVPFRSRVIFVHYAPRLGPHLNVVANSPHLFADSTWIVNDFGAKNADLLRFTKGRIPLAFYERDMHIEIDTSLVAKSNSARAPSR